MGNTCMHRPRDEEEGSCFLMFVLGGVAALGSNTQLLSERVWGLQLCYLVSESPLGQGADADLSQAA